MNLKLNLQSKLLFPTLGAVVLGMFIAALASYQASRNALKEALTAGMAQTADMSVRQIHAWTDDLQKDLHTLSQSPALRLSGEASAPAPEPVPEPVSETPPEPAPAEASDAPPSETPAAEGESSAETAPPEAPPAGAEAPAISAGGGDLSEAETLLRTAKADHPAFELIALADRAGQAVAASEPGIAGSLNVSDRPYFQQALAGKPSISDVVRSKVTNRPVFVLAAPVGNGSEVTGVLFAAVDMAAFTRSFIAPIKVGEKGYAFMVDAQGRFISHPDEKLVLDTNIKSYAWGNSLLEAAQGLLTYKFKGEHKILYHHREDLTGWRVAIAATEEDIFAPIARIRTLNFLAAVLTIFAVGAVIFFLVRGVVRMLRRGMDFAEAIRLGDISKRLHLPGSDEIGQLGAALDAMADGLAEKAKLAEAIAGGDLSTKVKLASEKDVLGKALTHMVTSLNDLLGQVQVTSEQIATGAAQVSDGSQSLSQGATESAASIEQIGSTLAEMASQTKTNAENAAQANHLTATAREAAENGNVQMSEMVRAMSEINAAGQNISRIIKVIDEIAFQTNLLALNAAVEAARAGQHGKGFAVVAEEVRNLAARSAKAARETADLIEGSVAKAENGAQIADRTAEALGEIVTGVTKVSDLVAEIAAASNEQAQGLSQVTIGLGQIDQVTQQNTANAEESAAAAEELAGQADGLRRMLGSFTLLSRPAAETGFSRPAPRPQAALPENHGWGGAQKSPPPAVIALDDGEFGKY